MILLMVQTSQNNHLETYKKKPFVKNLGFPSTNRWLNRFFSQDVFHSTLVDRGLYTRIPGFKGWSDQMFVLFCSRLFLDLYSLGWSTSVKNKRTSKPTWRIWNLSWRIHADGILEAHIVILKGSWLWMNEHLVFVVGSWLHPLCLAGVPSNSGEASAPPKNSPANPHSFWQNLRFTSTTSRVVPSYSVSRCFFVFFFGFFGTEENPTLEPTVGGFLHGRTVSVLALEIISGHLIIIRLLSEYSLISDYLLVLVDIYIFWYILTYHMTFYLFETNLFHSKVSKFSEARLQSWHGQFIYLWSQRSNLICGHLPWKSSWKWWVW